MTRLTFILALIFCANLTFAQDGEFVYLDKTLVSWFKTETSNYEEALIALKKGIEKNDEMLAYKGKKELKGALRRFSNNGISLYNRMLPFLDKAANDADKASPQDGNTNVYDNKMSIFRRDIDKVELVMTAAQADSFLENLAVIKNVADELIAEKYDFSATNTKSANNLSQVENVLTLATENNNLLRSSFTN